jgi:hypothetical protein
MSESKTCGNCLCCVKEEGPPYYCAQKDLYYLVTLNDKACADYAPDTPEELKTALIKELEKSIGGKIKRMI